MTLLVFLLFVALIFGVGAVVKGIFWLFVLCCLAIAAAVVVGAVRGISRD